MVKTSTHLSAIIAAAIALALIPSARAETTAIERHYCTQFGPFFMRFDPDKAAGVFTIHQNNDLGSVVGSLDERVFDGVWTEIDSRGEIRMTFSEDWAQFNAEYSVHDTPGEWRGGWVGRLAPDSRPQAFKAGDQTFYCH